MNYDQDKSIAEQIKDAHADLGVAISKGEACRCAYKRAKASA